MLILPFFLRQINRGVPLAKCSTFVRVKYKKPVPKPVVGFAWATDFNQTVEMDLKELGPSLWFLHIINEFTRLSNGAIIRSKTAVIKKFLHYWISLFGAPQKVISDNGGELDSNEFRDLPENFNITVKTTPAYSPWSNGLCEKHNHMLTETVLRVKENNKCDWETALAWSVCAKNSLINSKGFSPYQLVCGRNVNLQTVLSDKLPALEGQT